MTPMGMSFALARAFIDSHNLPGQDLVTERSLVSIPGGNAASLLAPIWAGLYPSLFTFELDLVLESHFVE